MAAIIRSAKSGSDWTTNDLRAYNINVVNEDIITFFGIDQLPPPPVRQAILTNLDYPANGLPDREDRLFFDYMHYAMLTPPGEESAVDDFAAHILSMLQYDEPDRVIRQRKDIPLFTCGSDMHAKTDVCVMDRRSGIILLVQEDKRYLEGGDPEPQLLAEAVAAFQFHNRQLRLAGQPIINAKVIPGIIMIGTAPIFYKIHVTAALIECIETAQYPAQVTIMRKLVPPVQRPLELQEEGMRPLDSRAVVFSCFEAFRQFI